MHAFGAVVACAKPRKTGRMTSATPPALPPDVATWSIRRAVATLLIVLVYRAPKPATWVAGAGVVWLFKDQSLAVVLQELGR